MTRDWVWILTDAQTERVNECFWLEIAKNKPLLGINNTIDINIFQVKDDSVMHRYPSFTSILLLGLADAW